MSGRSVRLALLSVLVLLLAPLSVCLAAGPDLATLPGHVARTMKEFRVPGLALAVLHKGETAFLQGFGVRSLETGEPVDADTLFAIGSSSKAFTATALCEMQVRGLIDLDAPVIETLPGFRLSDPWVTAHLNTVDLLSHRSGIMEHEMLWLWNQDQPDQETIVGRLRFFPLQEPFRASFNYNNFLYLTAGKELEAITGKSWAENMRELITAPLAMESVLFSVKELDPAGNTALPHGLDDEGGVARIPFRSTDNIAPAGSIIASARDMIKWLALNLGHATGENLPSQKALAATRLPRIAMPAPPDRLASAYPGAHSLTYGLGWFLHDYHGVELVEHGGNIDGMTAMVALAPDLDLGLVILCNMDESFIREALMYHLLDLYLGRAPGDWNTHFLARAKARHDQQQAELEQQIAARIPTTHPSLPLDAYTGQYENPMFGLLEVRQAGKNLEFEILGKSALLEHWHYDSFHRPSYTRDIPGVELLNFRLGEDGEVDGVEDSVMGWFGKKGAKGD